MIYTSYFAKHRKEDKSTAYVSIAVGNPKYPLAYKLQNLHDLKPYGIFGKYHGEEYKQKYFEMLDRKGVEVIRNELNILQTGGKDVLLMCHEKNPQECHRSMFAEWWYLRTGERIEEWEEKRKEELTQLSFFDRI